VKKFEAKQQKIREEFEAQRDAIVSERKRELSPRQKKEE
jgi:hypothetical protein